MDGNVFSNSLYQLGQYLMNNPQGTGQQNPGGPVGLPQKIDTTWTYGSPGNAAVPTNVAPPPPEQTTTALARGVPNQPEQFAQPNLPGAQKVPYQNMQVPDMSSGGAGGAGGAGGRAGGPGTGAPTQNAISGITGALSKGFSNAASAIAGVNTMPDVIQGGAIPSIQQQAMTLVGRRPQTAFYG